MLKPNNPDIDVDALMARVHHEVLRRQFGDGAAPGAAPDAVDISAVEDLIAAAAGRGGPRERWPARLRFFPFNLGIVQRFVLRLISWLFRDQHTFNAALVDALRESVALNVRLHRSIEELDRRLRRLEGRE
jgi:O-antigen chain-terminating methyltransferase